MSDRVEALLLELLDLARAQKAALETGNVDEAMKLSARRQVLAGDIQKIDLLEIPRKPSGQSVDGSDGTGGSLPGTLRATVEEILSVDRDMMAPVRAEMSAISDKLRCIAKLKQYVDDPSAPPLWGGTA